MIKKLLILILLISPTYAQQQQNKTPIQQRLEATIGSLIVENTSLGIKIEELQQKIKELEDRKNVGQNSK